MARVWKTAVCIVLIVTILSLSLSVFADDEPQVTEYPFDDGLAEINDTLMSYYIWLCMRAWGIEVTYQESLDWTEEISQQIIDWVLEYLDTIPSIYSINQWIAPWQSSYDYWGNYQFNNSLLEDVQDFVDWLCTQLGIQSNDSYVVNPIYSFGGYNLYKFNTFYRFATPEGEVRPDRVELNYDQTSGTGLFFFVAKIDNSFKLIFLSAQSTTVNYDLYQMDQYGTVSAIGGGQENVTRVNNNGLYYPSGWGIDALWWNNHGPLIPVDCHYFEGTSTQYTGFMNNAEIEREGDIEIITSTIMLPDNNPDYSGGDSVVIVDGQPTYAVIEWSGEVTVSNLPAVVSTGTITNPGINSFFGFIPALVDYTSDAFSLLVGIIYEMPEEVIIPIYAVFGSICLLGFIKLMREH